MNEKKVTKEKIDNMIENVSYYHHDNKVTICFIKLKNDFYVTGESGVVDRATFRKEIGEKYAFENAYQKIWILEGYHLAKN